MNHCLTNSSRRTLTVMVLAVTSMSMSYQALSEETAPTDNPRVSITEKAGFCYQGNEMVPCENAAAKEQQEPQGQGKTTQPPRIFDLEILLGGNPS